MNKQEWKHGYSLYRHIRWLTRNYFAHKRSMGKRSTKWKHITDGDKALKACVPNMADRVAMGQIHCYATSQLNRKYPSRPHYWWHTAVINAPNDPYWKGSEQPHRLSVYDQFPHWHFVLGNSPAGVVEYRKQGRKVRENHTVKFYCQNFAAWQAILNAPTIEGRDVPDMSPTLGGKCA